MSTSTEYLSPSQAAKRLGVTAKALRLWEERGLLAPARTEAGWRAYGPETMARAAEIVALREIGLSLGAVARALDGDAASLDAALAAHQSTLATRRDRIAAAAQTVTRLRAEIAAGRTPAIGELTQALDADPGPSVAFELPWPWGGERFELGAPRRLTYITGPLGSGKTRLAERLAETLPNAAFRSLDRLEDGGAATTRLEGDAELKARVEARLAWLLDEGASRSDALLTLLVDLDEAEERVLVIDLPEQGLDQPTQEALSAWLRRRWPEGRPLFLLTRSSSILDLAAVGPDEAILYCPANHSAPMRVAPFPGSPGYEAVATCLAPPEVRARTEGVIAWRPRSA